MNIHKAVIAAAGRGSRFLPLSKAYPKEFLAIMNKPLIQIRIEELIGCGIKEICIVHQPNDSQIERYFSINSQIPPELIPSLIKINQKVKLSYIEQSPKLPYGNATPILAAQDFIGQDNFIYFFGDGLTVEKKPGNFLKKMIITFEKEATDGAIVSAQVDPKNSAKYGMIVFKKIYQDFQVVDHIVEKEAPGTTKSNYIQSSKFIYKSTIFKHLLTQKIGKNNELWLTDTNNKIAQNGKLIAVPIDKSIIRLSAGDPLSWLKANLIYALNSPEYRQKTKAILNDLKI